MPADVVDSIFVDCLRQPDYLSNLRGYFPRLFHAPSFLIYSCKYYVHQAANGHIFHVAFHEQLGTSDIALTDETYRLMTTKKVKCVTAIQGVRENTLYLLRTDTVVLRATIVDGRSGRKRKYKPQLEVLETTLASAASPSFNIESSPYRAVCNDDHACIIPLECNPSRTLGTVITGFKKHFDDTTPLAKNSVIHRGYLIVFVFGDTRSCRKVDDRVIIVTSPLFEDFNSSILQLVYSRDYFNYVYLFVPAHKTLLIVDPTMLRFSENELIFKDGWKFEESDTNMINLIGVCDGIVSIGFPEFAITPHVQCRQLINYYVWRGKIPKPITWTTVNRDVSEKEGITNGSKENNPTDKLIYEAIQNRMNQAIERSKMADLTSKNEKVKPASWNVDVPAFVPKVTEPRINSIQEVVPNKNDTKSSGGSSSLSNEDSDNEAEAFDVIKFAETESKSGGQTQIEEDEFKSLREENQALEDQLREQKDRVENMRSKNEELKAENEKKVKVQATNLERLRSELQLLKESNDILEKKMSEPMSKANEGKEDGNQERNGNRTNNEETTSETDMESDHSEPPDWDDVEVENTNFDKDMCEMVETTAIEFEERCGTGNEPVNEEDVIVDPWVVNSPKVKPIGSEKKRKEKEEFILNNISSFIPDWSSSLEVKAKLDCSTPTSVREPSPSPPLSIFSSLARPSTPFGALFSGENFTAWSKTEATSSGWDEINHNVKRN